MAHRIHDFGVAKQIGAYSDALEVAPGARWLLTSGTPGLFHNGELPSDITGQAEIAWANILGILGQAGMGVQDLVKVTQYLRHASDIAAYAKVRARVLGGTRPASMLLIVPELVRPEFLLEIEASAARA